MKERLAIPVVLALVLAAGCMRFDPLRGMLGSYRNYEDTNGKIVNGRFYDPERRFSIQVPDMIEPGARIYGRFAKEGGTIQFHDDLGTLIRVDVFTAVGPEEEAATREAELHDLLEANRLAIGQLYTRACPGAVPIHQEYLSEGERVLDFYAFVMPEGATLSDAMSGKRRDALRVSISFREDYSLFTITSQHVIGMWREDEDLDQIVVRMKPELQAILATMSFRRPVDDSGK